MHPAKFMGVQGDIITPTMSDADKAARLEELCEIVAEKRKDAIAARKTSGIEDVWMMCEEAYIGIDDMNRSEYKDANWAKPTSMAGPVSKSNVSKASTRSTAYMPMTRRYVDNAAAKLSEILLPIDDKAFSFTGTPLPDLVDAEIRPLLDEMGKPYMRPAKPEEMQQQATQAPGALQQPGMQQPGMPPAQGMPPSQAPQVPKTTKDARDEAVEKANDAAKRAETRIYDWMVESKYPAEARKVVKDAARLGAGVLKGPYPEVITNRAASKIKGGMALQIKKEIKPVLRWVDLWNIFPAEGCGEDIHNGNYFLERDFLSEKKLTALIGQKGYLEDQIRKVIKEGPGKCNLEATSPQREAQNKTNYEIWYFYGELSREDLISAGTDGIEDEPQDREKFHAIVSMVNDTVIRAIINPLDSGDFPYSVMSWSRRPGSWAGVGVAEQIMTPQRMLNAATRAMLNNLGIASGPQIVMNRALVTPANNDWSITPNKMWDLSGEAQDTDVNKVFGIFNIPVMFEPMMGAIQYAERQAEEASGIPLITQGQQGPYSPETFGQAELQDNNAHTWLRSIGYAYDDSVTEPIVQRLYEWLLLDPEVPDDEKGDWNINAHGSIAMVERAIQEQTLMGMLNIAGNPAFGFDPKKVAVEYAKAKRLDPRNLTYTPEEMEAMSQKQPPPPPQVQAAQIRAQADQQKTQATLQADAQKTQALLSEKQQEIQATLTVQKEIAQERNQMDLHRVQVDTDRDTAYVNAQREKIQADAEANIKELELRERLAMLDYANKRELTLDQVKAQLSQTAMKLQTQKELSQLALQDGVHQRAHETVMTQVTAPPTEPEDKAAKGQAYAQ